jgi:uncharacterized protein involved in exopolysaccharide biosynthesis
MDNRKNDFVIVIEFFWRWKYYILGFSLISGIIAAIFTAPLFVHPRYKSTTVFYPSVMVSVSKALISEQGAGADKDFLSIGESQEAEQLLQILQSDVIAGKIKERYHLMEHYRINPGERYANTKFGNKFRSYVKAELTEYTSIRVTVIDEDPELAANIANDIVEEMDTIRNQILKQRAFEGLKIVQMDYTEKQQHVQSIIDSLNVISKKGVLKYEQQSDALTTAYSEALQTGRANVIKEIENKMDLVAKYGPAQEMLTNELEYETEQLVILRGKYKQAKIDMESFTPNKFIIEKAYKAEKKTYPKRMIITLISMVSAFLFSCLCFILFEKIKEIDFSLKPKVNS